MSDPNLIAEIPNTFMGYVARAVQPKFGQLIKYWKWNKKYKAFKKMIMSSAPDFGTLWQFAEFIKQAEMIFFYNNNKNEEIYSSTGYNPGENGFKLRVYDDAEIIVKLFIDNETVMMDLNRLKGTNLKNSYVFQGGQWMYNPDCYDMILLDQVESIISKAIIYMIDWCIDAKFKYSIN